MTNDQLSAIADRIITYYGKQPEAPQGKENQLSHENDASHANGANPLTHEEAEAIAAFDDLDFLCDQADRIRLALCGNTIDSCSIINARSGLCGEDCKWCAQSVHHSTGCDKYDFLSADKVLEAGRYNEREGIHRFSLVTSGRTLSEKDTDKACEAYRLLGDKTDLYLCASMGLLSEEQLQKLADAGVKRYHCNMETSSKVFPHLCSTHTQEQKRATIEAARRVGMEICSGGIIGMGEAMSDRIDFAFELAEMGVDSVPMNILNPIPGTPLENTPLISEEEIIRTGAVWRFILGDKFIRFAGGRGRLSKDSMLRMLRGGVNGVLMGDMLTTVSHDIATDRVLFEEAEYDLGALKR